MRYIDGKPGIISDDSFDEKIVRGTELAAPEDTTREDILKGAGYEQVYDIDEIITRMPTSDEVTPARDTTRNAGCRAHQDRLYLSFSAFWVSNASSSVSFRGSAS